MRNFTFITGGADVDPLRIAVQSHPELWNRNPLRRLMPDSAHREADDILLRYCQVPADATVQSVLDDLEAINYDAMWKLPQARPLLFGLMARVEGERLGRALITRLPPGGRIHAHRDEGAAAAYYDRFHVVLQSAPGIVFRAGDEQVEMRLGEVWRFDNSLPHEVVNDSAIDRIHLIVDVRVSR